MILLFAQVFIVLLAGHFIADIYLQSDVMARNKNRHSIPAGYDPNLHGVRQSVWPYYLMTHGLTHGFFVWLATGKFWLGVAETVCHCTIDFFKCEKKYGIHVDQFLHFGCKVVWVLIMFYLALNNAGYGFGST